MNTFALEAIFSEVIKLLSRKHISEADFAKRSLKLKHQKTFLQKKYVTQQY